MTWTGLQPGGENGTYFQSFPSPKSPSGAAVTLHTADGLDLAAITVVLSLPTMIASFYGMNVDLPLDHLPSAVAFKGEPGPGSDAGRSIGRRRTHAPQG